MIAAAELPAPNLSWRCLVIPSAAAKTASDRVLEALHIAAPGVQGCVVRLLPARDRVWLDAFVGLVPPGAHPAVPGRPKRRGDVVALPLKEATRRILADAIPTPSSMYT